MKKCVSHNHTRDFASMTNLISAVDCTDELYHRFHFMLWTVKGTFALGTFDTEQQLRQFAKTLGFSYRLVESRVHDRFGRYREFRTDKQIVDPGIPFRSLAELPQGCKPIMALSNGRIVKCYFYDDGKTIYFYRPNPNYPEIYQPLHTAEHIRYHQRYGTY